jgi:glycosyltransferase involved in cell wall biosynthesis
LGKIRILHITPVLTIGGAEQKLFYILKGLKSDQFSHHVIYAIPGELTTEIKNKGIPLSRIYPMSLINPFSLSTVWRIYRYIKKNHIDIVHCHLDVAYIIGGLAAFLARVPLIFSFQNIADERYLRFYKVYKYLEKASSFFTDKFLVESEDVMKVLLAWGIRKDKIEVIPNGVEIPGNIDVLIQKSEAIRKKLGLEGRFLIGNLARLVDFKNHKLLLNAAAKVINMNPNATFLIIGDGPLREELKVLSDKRGISNHVVFLGTVMDFEPYLILFDIFVISSFTESTPMSLLHALAYRRPVISTAVGDIPSIIQDTINGILVPSDDPRALAKAILDLLEDAEKRNKIAFAGRELAKEKFSIQTMIDGIERIYLDVMDKHAGSFK